MAKTHPPAARKDTMPAGRLPPAPRMGTHRTNLTVRYYSRMRRQVVYRLAVEVPRAARGQPAPATTGEMVTVRAMVPGAVVVPAEQKLDVSVPGRQAVFHVTPVATGRLVGARVEVAPPGNRPAQEIPLRMKSVTQFWPWFWLALAVLVPAALWYWTAYAPVKGYMVKVPAMKLQPQLPAGGVMPPGGPNPPGGGQPPGGLGAGAVVPPREAALVGPFFLVLNPPEPGEKLQEEWVSPRQAVQERIDGFLTDQVPQIPTWNKTVRPPVARGLEAVAGLVQPDAKLDDQKSLTAQVIAVAYDYLSGPELHAAFWSMLILLGMSCVSWLMHTGSRASTRKAVDLPAAPASPQAQETLPLAPGEGHPETVAPID
jgi:hypothetical protein